MASMHMAFKSGKPGKAAGHAQYIGRLGPYKARGSDDLVATWHGNLPPGIEEPMMLWQAADKGERVNGAAYREIVGALPRELTVEQNTDLVKELVRKIIPNKPHQVAIHNPDAALASGSQPHFHLMFSDRIADGIARPPEIMFRRYNPTHPERGGYRKDSGGKSPVELKEQAKALRETFATLQNIFLERFGHEARVDHRSYRDRGMSRAVEHHLGPAAIRAMTKEERVAFVGSRTH